MLSRSARSATRWSDPSSSVSIRAFALTSSSSVTSSTPRRATSSRKAASTASIVASGRTVAQPMKTDGPDANGSRKIVTSWAMRPSRTRRRWRRLPLPPARTWAAISSA